MQPNRLAHGSEDKFSGADPRRNGSLLPAPRGNVPELSNDAGGASCSAKADDQACEEYTWGTS